MILGRFDFGRPVIDCHVTIKSINIDGVIPFLVDTGCDRTTLMPVDSVRLGVPFDQLTNEKVSYGFGGASAVYLMPAALVIADKKVAYGYRFGLDIAKPHVNLEGMPSLLGRDILQYWKLTLDFPERKFSFEIQMCDEEFQL
jgi:hypothetical protein